MLSPRSNAKAWTLHRRRSTTGQKAKGFQPGCAIRTGTRSRLRWIELSGGAELCRAAPEIVQIDLSSKNAGQAMVETRKGRWCMDFMHGTCTKSILRMY